VTLAHCVLKRVFPSQIEVKSSKTIIIVVTIVGTNNWEEDTAAMKAMLEKLTKESKEKEMCIEL